jgi:lysophospholipase L1-like esterase
MKRPFIERYIFVSALFGILVELYPGQTHAQQAKPLKIAIIGDSTVADYKDTDPLRGWGQMLPEFFVPGTQIDNLAQNGRSTKTFLINPRWKKALDDKADFLLIQFGHNDSHRPLAQHPEATVADGDYADNLRKYIAAARADGETPILVTPMHRRTFQPDGMVTQELLPYVRSMEKVAQEQKVPVIDIYTKSGELFEKLGDAGSTDFTPKDRTHFGPKGARVMAYFVAEGAALADNRLKAAEVSPLPDPTANLSAPQAASSPVASGTGGTLQATMETEVAPK